VKHKGEGEEGYRIKSRKKRRIFFFLELLRNQKERANEKNIEDVEAFSLSSLGGEFVPLDVFNFDWK